MENIISRNNLSYMGKVELFLVKNGKQIKFATFNEGLAGIAELFTRTCLGYPVDNYRPFYVDIREEETNESGLAEPVELRASTFDVVKASEISSEEDAYMIGWKYPIFDALIENENIINVDTGTYYVYLLSINMTPLARVKIKVDKDYLGKKDGAIPTLSLRDGNNILIKWSMYLSNRTEKDNG